MKKRWKAVFGAVFSLCMAVSVGAAGLAFADDGAAAAPERNNIALGKEVVFKSLDMTENLTVYNYTPPVDNAALGDINQLGKNVMTDGNRSWEKNNANCTARDTVGWAYLDLGAEYVIDGVGVAFLGSWLFEDVIIQVSTTPDFSEDVTTVLATSDSLAAGDVSVYSGGTVLNGNGELSGLWQSPFNSRWYINNVSGSVHDFPFPARAARYVRLTDKQQEFVKENHTIFSEIEVYEAPGDNFAPAPSLVPGSYSSFGKIALTSAYDGATVYYSTDGKFPATAYTQPIDADAVGSSFLLRTVARRSDGTWTNVGEFQYIDAEAEVVNVALNKQAVFKSLDMAEELTMYSYYPDGNAGTSVGCYPLDETLGCVMTDGVYNDWTGFRTNATFKDTVGWAVIDLQQEYTVDSMGIHVFSGWQFGDFVIQFSNDPLFQEGVTTVLSNTTAPLVYNGQTIYSGEQVNVAGNAHFSGTQNENYMSTSNVLTNFTFDAVTARYVRLTNRSLEVSGDRNTIFCEVQVYSAQTSAASEEAIREITVDESVKTEYPFGTSKESILAALPAQAEALLTDGSKVSLSLTWECSDWKENTAGNYTFTADFALPANTVNFFGIEYGYEISIAKAAPSVTVTYIGEALFTSDAYPAAEDFKVESGVPGSLTITAGTLVEGTNNIAWTFIPDDGENYAPVQGTTVVEVSAVELTGIEITAQPTKTEYFAGETFDPAGMVVTAKYNDGSSKAVTDYTVDKTELAIGDTAVTVSYDGKTATVSISVSEKADVPEKSGGCSSAVAIGNFAVAAAFLFMVAAGWFIKKKS